MERGIYEDSTRMYAPYYRQAAMKIYDLTVEERQPYLELAYSDVSDAFAWYLENENEGRPIILAGFSQGADMCYRLLEDYFGRKATVTDKKHFLANKIYVDYLWTLWAKTRVPYSGQDMEDWAAERYARMKDSIAAFEKL